MTPVFPLLLSLVIAADDALAVRLTRGQELVYRGKFTEESRGPVPDRRAYDLEARSFVLETRPDGIDTAFLTVLRGTGAAPDAAGSARLELAAVDQRGRVTLHVTGAAPRIPLDGPPSLEPAGFVELPAGPANTWDVADGQRPPREWRVVAVDFYGGVRCLKLIGEQVSAEWRQPTGNAPAWRRSDVVWLAVATGTVRRLERTVERRSGGDGSAGYSARTEYELAESTIFPDRLAAERRREVLLIAELNQRLAALLSRTARTTPVQFEGLLAQIDRVPSQPAYRPAVVALRHRAEAGARGEVPPPADAADPPGLPPTLGRPAPDFVTTDLVNGTPMRLARRHDRPTVLLFVRPDSPVASSTLELAKDLQARYADRLRVAVLVVADEETARPAWAAAGVPLFAGRDPAAVYTVTGASRVVVVDADGVVRHLGDAGPGVKDAVQRVVAPVGGK
jgi:hypothetical protein